MRTHTHILFWPAFALMLGLGACSDTNSEHQLVGYVEADLTYLSAIESGRIITLYHTQGDIVSMGDVVFSLDDTLQQASLQEATRRSAQSTAQKDDLKTGARQQELLVLEAQLNQVQAKRSLASIELKRIEALVGKDFAAQASLDRAIAELQVATAEVRRVEENIKAAKLGGRDATQIAATEASEATKALVDQAAWRLQQRNVAAPVSGRIEHVFYREGEIAPAGAPIVAILPDDAMKVRFFVPQAILGSVHPGDVISIKSDGQAQASNATITFVASQAEFTPPIIYSVGSREKLVFMVEAQIQTPESFRPGLPVDVFLQ